MADGSRTPGEDEDDPDDDAPELPLPWSSTTRIVAAILWSSFLAACLATMLTFALVDPELIYHATTPPMEISRATGYGVGFFFFWAIGALSSSIAVLLLRSRGDQPDRQP